MGYLEEENGAVVAIVTTKSVEKANWFVLVLKGIGGFFSEMWVAVM